MIKGDEKILIIQFRPVGDILLTTPVAEYLKENFPGVKISFLVFEQFYPVLEHNPFIDEILEIKKISKKGLFNFFRYIFHKIEIISRVRKNRYDIVLDYIGLPSSAIISFFSGAKYKVGYGDIKRGFLYNIKAGNLKFERYAVVKKYDLLAPFGIPQYKPLIKTRLYFSEEENKFADNFYKTNNLNNKFVVLFSPDSPKIYKRWRFENYRDLGKRLAGEYAAKILIQHGPGEKEYCEKLVREIGPSAILLPDTSILETADKAYQCCS
jgi:ADP-heptose:LPS heptosyltransferase